MKLDVTEAKRVVEASLRREAIWKELESHNSVGAWVTYVVLFGGLLAYPFVLSAKGSIWGVYGILVMTFSLLHLLERRRMNTVVELLREYERVSQENGARNA